jgi:hypothetical protein
MLDMVYIFFDGFDFLVVAYRIVDVFALRVLIEVPKDFFDVEVSPEAVNLTCSHFVASLRLRLFLP